MSCASYWKEEGNRVSVSSETLDLTRIQALAENLNRLLVQVLLKPFHIDDLLKVIAEVLAAQMLVDQACAERVRTSQGGVPVKGAPHPVTQPAPPV